MHIRTTPPFLLTLGYLFHYTAVSAYELRVNGQTIQVDIVNDDGDLYKDRDGLTDDFGNPLSTQKDAICSSLRNDLCPQATKNAANTHNLFNYFPHHTAESVVAHSNARYHAGHIDAHGLKQPMDDRTLVILNKQNPHSLGTMPTETRPSRKVLDPDANAQSMMEGLNALLSGDVSDLKHVGTRTIKYNKKKKVDDKLDSAEPGSESTSDDGSTQSSESTSDSEAEEIETEIEIEFYSTGPDGGELARAFGADDDIVDSFVQQFASYMSELGMDEDDEGTDLYSQLFGDSEQSGERSEKGDVVEQDFILDLTMDEINDFLKQITNSDGDDEEGKETTIFAMKVMMEGDEHGKADNMEGTEAVSNTEDESNVDEKNNSNTEPQTEKEVDSTDRIDDESGRYSQ